MLEYYILIEKLLSVYDMLYEQAEVAIQETANELLDWKKYWSQKSYNHDVPKYANTLTQRKNVGKSSTLFETMALNLFIEDNMKNPNSKTCIFYSYYDLGMSKVGSYVMQSLTINGFRRSLKIFSVFTEGKPWKIYKLPHCISCKLKVIVSTVKKTSWTAFLLLCLTIPHTT